MEVNREMENFFLWKHKISHQISFCQAFLIWVICMGAQMHLTPWECIKKFCTEDLTRTTASSPWCFSVVAGLKKKNQTTKLETYFLLLGLQSAYSVSPLSVILESFALNLSQSILINLNNLNISQKWWIFLLLCNENYPKHRTLMFISLKTI